MRKYTGCRKCNSQDMKFEYRGGKIFYNCRRCSYCWQEEAFGQARIDKALCPPEPKQKTNHRKPWDEYWMDIAFKASERSTCDRRHVGAVIVRQDNSIISTGYNGSDSGEPHCDDVGHLMVDGSCKRTTHAEDNAIKFAKKYGLREDLKGAKIYCTDSPCDNCLGLIITNNIKEIYYAREYPNDYLDRTCEEHGISLEEIKYEKTT